MSSVKHNPVHNAAILRSEHAADVIHSDNNFDLQRRKATALLLSCAPISHSDSMKHVNYLQVCLLVLLRQKYSTS